MVRKNEIPKTAAIGSAAVASLLALQSHADAALVYSGIVNATVQLGTAGSRAGTRGYNSSWSKLQSILGPRSKFDLRVSAYQAFIQEAGGGAAQFVITGTQQLKKFASGAVVTSGAFNRPANATIAFRSGSFSQGNFQANQTGFAAFGFRSTSFNPNIFTGWARLRWDETAPGSNRIGSLTLVDFAYNDVANQSIAMGAGAAAAAVPEPNSMALLALAVGGVAAYRKRRGKRNQPAEAQAAVAV